MPMPKPSLRFVQRVNGYCYFRKTGHKRIRLPAEGSPEFNAAYERALRGSKPELTKLGFAPGSLGWAIDKYTTSAEFNSKARGTQAAYLVSLRTLRDAPMARGLVRATIRRC